MAQNVAKILTVDLWRHSKHKRHWMRSGGLRPPKHTRVLANAKTLASSPAARAHLLPAPLARPAAGPMAARSPASARPPPCLAHGPGCLRWPARTAALRPRGPQSRCTVRTCLSPHIILLRQFSHKISLSFLSNRY